MILALPNVSYNPANGFTAGATGSAGFYIGPRETTRVSSIGFNLAVTSKRQLIATIKSNLYTPDNGFFLQGDWRFLIYNAATWGLGTNAPDSIESNNIFVWQGAEIGEIEDGYPMSYNYLKLHEILNYEIGNNKYVGLGYHLDRFARIRDHKLQLETRPYELTPHYLYSMLHGFDSAAYVLSGLSLNLVYDSRDNQINAYEGHYAHLSYRINPPFLGSSQASSSLWMEFRTYQSLSKSVPRHLLAFWFFGNFLVSGQQPYLTLMALGEDQRARSGRGYIAGRYRGEDLIYAEMEYRFPITPCTKILGGVLFLNATTASSRSGGVSLFQYVRPGMGFGLRLMLNKYFRTNINIDFAFGRKSNGLYFSGAETF
jgi:outer membrane protein assembly factor BamA